MGLRRALTSAFSISASALGGAIAGTAIGVSVGRSMERWNLSTPTALWLLEKMKTVAQRMEQRYAWCRDCEADDRNNVDGYGYMLVDEVWAEALNGDEIDYLCIPCVCARLQRSLTLEDFAELPINGAVWSGMMLAGALTPAKVHELQRLAAGSIPFAAETRSPTFDGPLLEPDSCDCEECDCEECDESLFGSGKRASAVEIVMEAVGGNYLSPPTGTSATGPEATGGCCSPSGTA